MNIFMSKPSIISSAGDENALLRDITECKKSLQSLEFNEKNFMVGRIKDELLDLKFISNPTFATRTNAIALSAILPLENQVKKLVKKYGKENIGVIVGTTTTGVEENYKTFRNGIFNEKEFDFDRNSLANPAKFIKNFFGLGGVAYSISTACTSGIKAISEAADLVRAGICKAVIAGGVDSLNTLTLFGFNSLSILSDDMCDPFSKDRKGTNLGEGAAFMIIGDEEVGEVCIKSYASNSDAFHMTSPRDDGFYQTMLINEALQKANLNDVDYVNLHATATIANDMMEANAVFSSKTNAPCSGIKQFIGHCLGAAGAIESGVCSMLIGDKKALPLQVIKSDIDPVLKPLNLVINKQTLDIKNTMSLSFAFGGDNACIILGRK
ncbi:MatE efflux family protein [Campylobacter hyointestinalis subsp. hyointestinalis]|uniref:MatE efflux family protein n=1 Tax=Campylobacter hyointestinalis subsp. hyointestinalis TaxID=91352 RepID=A0A0S4R818_CAMHY|nr:beta-ketoacyl synthase N-terminal-like domain-containing protein [Campylobacter hyointestinalis]CUU70256.1 MatE efflux family protein [Campylobacter hyointestinalis subsp. hyointestinalis]